MMKNRITMLGTGSALVTKCFNTCFVLTSSSGQHLLVDTGGGNGILSQLERAGIERGTISDLYITHGHTDHAMGAGEFDVVYMNHKDDYIYGPHGEEAFRRDGMTLSEDYDKMEAGDYIPTAPTENFHDLKGGDSFDLLELI